MGHQFNSLFCHPYFLHMQIIGKFAINAYHYITDYYNDLKRKFIVNILKNGPIPKHIAFIMDGNRRFSKKKSEHSEHGHRSGGDTLKKVLIISSESSCLFNK